MSEDGGVAMREAWQEAARIRDVQLPVIPVIGSLIREHPGAISLGQGMVHYGPPAEALEGIREFLSSPENHRYQPVMGLPALRDALRAKLVAENGLPPGAANTVAVTAGGNMGFLNAVLAVAEPGDEVILQSPFYFNHEMAVRIAGCVPVPVATDDDYLPRPDALRAAITPRTRALVTISPNNPTGAVYPEALLRTVNALCAEKHIFHIHDEAYEYFTYDGARHVSPLSFGGNLRHTVGLYSLSKSYGFASWRIGWMALPPQLEEAVNKIQDTNLICPPVISQYAALGALRAGAAYCRQYLPELAASRLAFLEELAKLRSFCRFPPTQGAFYFLLHLDTELKPLDLATRLVREFGVGAIPGDAFGVTEACSLRVSYGALRMDAAVEGVRRLARGLTALLARR